MTYLRCKSCRECGQPLKGDWFRHWVGEKCIRPKDGLSVTDADLIFHRFMRKRDARGERGIEDIMLVELKAHGEGVGKAQGDTLATFNAVVNNLPMPKGKPIGVASRPMMVSRGKKVVWHGAHLLEVPLHRNDAGPFRWDWRPIAAQTLALVLSFENDPRRPETPLDIARRHKRIKETPLLTQMEGGNQ